MFRCIEIIVDNFYSDLRQYINDRTDQHNYHTRNSSAITLPIFSKVKCQSSIYYMGCKVWNNISEDLKECETFISFKVRLKKVLLL